MNFRERFSLKILSLLLTALLSGNPFLVPVALAQEEEEVPLVQEEAAGDAAIITGDAESLAQAETVVNQNETELPGAVTAPADECSLPEIEGGCDEPVVVATENVADVAEEATSSADTGKNEIVEFSESEVDTFIDTGEATAGALLNNKANTNVVELEPTATPTEEPENHDEDLGEEQDEPGLTVLNDNEALVANEAGATANTGANKISASEGEAAIETGDALAYANVLNLLNTNVVGTDFEIQFLDFLENYQGSLDFNQIWEEFVAQGGTNPSLFQIQNSNLAILDNQVEVVANSGDNEIDGSGEAAIKTGSATALANVINLVNLNLVGSQFFLGVLNIFGNFEGDLIFPAPEKFLASVGATGSDEGAGAAVAAPVAVISQNTAMVSNEVTAGANTGANQVTDSQGDSVIQTGNAVSQANAVSVVNTNIQSNNWFFLMINNFSRQLAQVFGWAAPGETESLASGEPNIFQLGLSAESMATSSPGSSQSVVANQNDAAVTNQVTATANTGANQINDNQGDSRIETGDAKAVSNLVNLVNLNILGSRWFMGLVNIFGDWQGNVVFAYPDVEVKLTDGLGQAMVGEQVHYQLHYQNQGYDQAAQVWAQIILPRGISYVSDNSGLAPDLAGQTCAWFLGDLTPGQKGVFDLIVQVNADFEFGQPEVARARLIPQVYAAANEQTSEVEMKALIATVDVESSLDNNTAVVKTRIYKSQPLEEDVVTADQTDQAVPVLQLSAQNNVGEFVYPGDVVTFEIKLQNTGGQVAKDVYLTQELTNSLPEESFGAAFFPVGDLQPGQAVTLTFGLQLVDTGIFTNGLYHTYAQAVGFDAAGEEVVSNQAATEFPIRVRLLETFWETKAAVKEEEILGVFQPQCPLTDKPEDILPYALLFLVSSLGLVDRSRRLFQIEHEK